MHRLLSAGGHHRQMPLCAWLCGPVATTLSAARSGEPTGASALQVAAASQGGPGLLCPAALGFRPLANGDHPSLGMPSGPSLLGTRDTNVAGLTVLPPWRGFPQLLAVQRQGIAVVSHGTMAVRHYSAGEL